MNSTANSVLPILILLLCISPLPLCFLISYAPTNLFANRQSYLLTIGISLYVLLQLANCHLFHKYHLKILRISLIPLITNNSKMIFCFQCFPTKRPFYKRKVTFHWHVTTFLFHPTTFQMKICLSKATIFLSYLTTLSRSVYAKEPCRLFNNRQGSSYTP